MSNVVALPTAEAPGSRAPANLDLEHAVLGIALYDNEAIHVMEGLGPDHFHEPAHGRIWATITDLLAKGMMADPIMVSGRMTSDQALTEFGGIGFLADLVDQAPPSSSAATFAREIIQLAQRRDLIKLAEQVIENARQDEDALRSIGLAEAGLLAMQVKSRPLELITASQASAKVLADLDAPEEARTGIKTGIEALDEALGPLLPGNLLLLMGRPSMGKSAAAECIALNIAASGHGVIQINGEMSPEEMTQRHLTDICQARWGYRGPEYRDIRRRRIGHTQREMLQKAHGALEGLPLAMLKRPGLKLSQLRSIARRQAAAWARKGVTLGALIVDHVGLLHPDQSLRDRYADQTVVSNAMKELADELQCVVIGLNQMNRQNENRDDKRPQLSDLRDSGSWEQDADFVIGWYREAYYAQRQTEPKKEEEIGTWLNAKASKKVEAIILKARAGECLTVNLWGDVARNAIRSQAPEDGDLM